mgnify:CR=1 FL=1
MYGRFVSYLSAGCAAAAGAAASATGDEREVPFSPARVVLQDFTGVPCVVDLAAMRDAMREMGGDPSKIYLWGHSAGGAHVADYIVRTKKPGIAGAVLTSGIYTLGQTVSAWKDYYGEDVSRYAERESLPLLAVVASVVLWLGAGRYVETDNAYVKGDRVYISTEIAGPIVKVAVTENQRVSRGQLLYQLDDTPYRLQLAKIEADIEIQRAEIRSLRAQWRTKREDIKAAQSQLNYAQSDFERQKDLAERKFAPAAKMEETRMAAEVARQRIASLQEDLQRIEAQLAGDPKIRVDDHPRVKQMLASRDEALLNLRRTTIEAPMDGVVSKVQVPGNYVVAGTPAMVVVADTDLWIEANFTSPPVRVTLPPSAKQYSALMASR